MICSPDVISVGRKCTGGNMRAPIPISPAAERPRILVVSVFIGCLPALRWLSSGGVWNQPSGDCPITLFTCCDGFPFGGALAIPTFVLFNEDRISRASFTEG